MLKLFWVGVFFGRNFLVGNHPDGTFAGGSFPSTKNTNVQ